MHAFEPYPMDDGAVIKNYDVVECDEFEDFDPCGSFVTPEMLDPYAPTGSMPRLAIGDTLEIVVLGEEDTLVENAVITPDGYLYYAFLDGIPAAGRTIPEVSREIEAKLGTFFINPVVFINPRTSLGNYFRILGRVERPGLYPISRAVRLRDAIALAGGLPWETLRDKERNNSIDMTVDFNSSFLVRDNLRLNIDFRSLIMCGDDSENIFLHPGDYIYLAPKVKQEVFVLGAVKAPRRITLFPNMTLMGALAAASGIRMGDPFSADIKRVLVIRGSLQCPQVAQVNVCDIINGEARDIYLRTGDIIYAQNKNVRFGRILVRVAIASFVYAFGIGAADFYAPMLFPIPPIVPTTSGSP